MVPTTTSSVEKTLSVDWEDIYNRERKRLFLSRIIRVYAITLVTTLLMYTALFVSKPEVFDYPMGIILRVGYVGSLAVGLLIAYRATSLKGIWLSVIVSIFFSTCTLEGILIMQPTHQIPKYILFLAAPFVALMLPVRPSEMLQVALGLPILHAGTLPWQQTSDPVIDCFLLLVSGTFAMASVYVTDNLRKTNAIKEALLLREQSKFWNLQKQLDKHQEERTSRLQEQSIQLGFLSQEIQELEQRERERIGSLLHDHLQQDLAAAKIQANVARRENDKEACHKSLEVIEEALSNAINVTRTITASVVPNIPIKHGLHAALHHLTAQLKRRFALHVDLVLDTNEPFEPITRSILYDSARELLFNIVKHSGVKQAKLSLYLESDSIWKLKVSDQGKGYEIHETMQGESLGLQLLRQRIENRDGTMAVESSINSGTTVEITIAKRFTSSQSTNRETSISEEDETAENLLFPKIRILVADENQDSRATIAKLIEKLSDVELIGEAQDGQQALEMAFALEPDILIIDVNISAKSGIEVTSVIRQQTERTSVIGFSMSDSARIAQQFILAGGDVYLLKSMLPSHLINTIRTTKRARDWMLFRSNLRIR